MGHTPRYMWIGLQIVNGTFHSTGSTSKDPDYRPPGVFAVSQIGETAKAAGGENSWTWQSGSLEAPLVER